MESKEGTCKHRHMAEVILLWHFVAENFAPGNFAMFCKEKLP
jgi:hypothetical protein